MPVLWLVGGCAGCSARVVHLSNPLELSHGTACCPAWLLVLTRHDVCLTHQKQWGVVLLVTSSAIWQRVVYKNTSVCTVWLLHAQMSGSYHFAELLVNGMTARVCIWLVC